MRVFKNDAEKYISKLAAALTRDPKSLDTWRCLRIAFKDDDGESLIFDPQMLDYVKESYKHIDCDIIVCTDGDLLLISEDLDAGALENLAAALTSHLMDATPTITLYHLFEDWREIRGMLSDKAQHMVPESTITTTHHFGDVSSLKHVFDEAKKLRKARKPQHIMVVEDDPLTRRIIANAFKGDYAMITATNAQEAIESYLFFAPDIVFLDIGLPDASGFDVLRQIISSDADAYVVMFSGNSYLDNVTTALCDGASGFIAKPFQKEKLYHYIDDSALHHHKQGV